MASGPQSAGEVQDVRVQRVDVTGPPSTWMNVSSAMRLDGAAWIFSNASIRTADWNSSRVAGYTDVVTWVSAGACVHCGANSNAACYEAPAAVGGAFPSSCIAHCVGAIMNGGNRGSCT